MIDNLGDSTQLYFELALSNKSRNSKEIIPVNSIQPEMLARRLYHSGVNILDISSNTPDSEILSIALGPDNLEKFTTHIGSIIRPKENALNIAKSFITVAAKISTPEALANQLNQLPETRNREPFIVWYQLITIQYINSFSSTSQ